jgi:hypothetical protein
VGTGKSYLVSNVIDHLQQKVNGSQNDEDKFGLAYFYCRRTGEHTDSLAALRCLVRQTACDAQDPSRARQSLKDLWNSKGEKAHRLNDKDCYEQLLESVNQCKTTFIILDAVDELDRQASGNGTLLLKTLHKIADKAIRPVKVFFSSRTGANITEPIEAPSEEHFTERIIPCIEVSSKNNKDDIRAFVAQHIQQIPLHTFSGSEQLRKKVQEKVLAEAGEMQVLPVPSPSPRIPSSPSFANICG